MTDSDFQDQLRYFEANISCRPLTLMERAWLKKFLSDANHPDPLVRARHELKVRLILRQGSDVPDFDALYRRKAELDGEA